MNEFFNWLFKRGNQKSGHQLSHKKEKLFIDMKTIWEESAKSQIPESPDNQMEWIRLQRSIKIAENKTKITSTNPFMKLFSQPKLAFGLSILLICVVTVSMFLHQSTGIKTFTTANKETKSVVLADGSTVQLNSGSRLVVPKNFNKKSRHIRLEGEAFFEVQKNNVPFQVKTEIGTVTVLGTMFNVNSRNDRMEVAVNEGIVRVTSMVAQKDSSVMITKGKYCLCQSNSFPESPQSIDFKEYPGWLYNKLTLKESNLPYVLKEIERRFDVSIRQDEKQLNDLKISGLFDASELDSLMSSLCILIQKKYRQENNEITIY